MKVFETYLENEVQQIQVLFSKFNWDIWCLRNEIEWRILSRISSFSFCWELFSTMRSHKTYTLETQTSALINLFLPAFENLHVFFSSNQISPIQVVFYCPYLPSRPPGKTEKKKPNPKPHCFWDERKLLEKKKQ